MYQILNNWLYLFTGMLGGFVLGWSLRTMQDVRHMKNLTSSLERKVDLLWRQAHRVPQQRKPRKERVRNERGAITSVKIAWACVLTFTAVAAIWTGVVNNKLAHSQFCTEHTFGRVIGTLNDRTATTTDVNIADTAQSEAFATLLTKLLDTQHPATETEKVLLTQDYLSKLVTYNKAKAERDKSTDFPTKEEYKKCLEGG